MRCRLGVSAVRRAGRPLLRSMRSLHRLITALCHREPTRAAPTVQIRSEMLAEPHGTAPLMDSIEASKDASVLRTAVLAPGHLADRRAAAPLCGVLSTSSTLS